jgi:hypothetical protein
MAVYSPISDLINAISEVFPDEGFQLLAEIRDFSENDQPDEDYDARMRQLDEIERLILVAIIFPRTGAIALREGLVRLGHEDGEFGFYVGEGELVRVELASDAPQAINDFQTTISDYIASLRNPRPEPLSGPKLGGG